MIKTANIGGVSLLTPGVLKTSLADKLHNFGIRGTCHDSDTQYLKKNKIVRSQINLFFGYRLGAKRTALL